MARYLTARQFASAQRGVAATVRNNYERQPLTLHTAGTACDEFIKTLSPYPHGYEGRGIVICAGGRRYLANAWVCLKRLRAATCRLPVQVWHLGKAEIDEKIKTLFAGLGAECVDAHRMKRKHPARIRGGWELKPYAMLHSPFRQVMLLDADNVAVRDPSFLFDTPEFEKTGAIFWPDYYHADGKKALPIWRSCGLRRPAEPEFETGQIVLDKERCWKALCLALWFNEHSDFYYRFIYGDKETFHLAFRKLKQKYSLVPKPIHPLDGTMCQHDFQGLRLFQHRNSKKWDLLANPNVKDFWFEKECLGYLKALRLEWLAASTRTPVRVA
jgi:hypothetical protein